MKRTDHTAAQRWWPTVQHEAIFELVMATNESLGTLAVPYPVILSEERIASR